MAQGGMESGVGQGSAEATPAAFYACSWRLATGSRRERSEAGGLAPGGCRGRTGRISRV